MPKFFNLDNIKKIEFDVTNMICNSDDKPVCATGTESFAVLFNETQISEDEVRALIDNNNYVYDERLVVMSVEMANRLKDIMC